MRNLRRRQLFVKKLAALFTSSSQEMRQVKTVTVCAVIAAIGMVLGSLTIYITDTVRIGSSGTPIAPVSYLLGPVVGGTFGGALDVPKYLAKPMGPLMSGLTLITILEGLLYGCSLYKKSLTLRQVLVTQPVMVVACSLLLSTLCLSFVYGEVFMMLLVPRIIRNLIIWPIDTFIFSNTIGVLETTGAFRTLGKTKTAARFWDTPIRSRSVQEMEYGLEKITDEIINDPLV